MDFKTFKREMQRTEPLSKIGSKRSAYWRGYQRGLRRTYYKEELGTSSEYLQLLRILHSEDKNQKLIIQGYVDALREWGQ